MLLQSGHADPCGRVQGEEPAVYIHTLDTLDTFATLLHVADSEVACLAFSRDGERLVTVTREPDLTLIVWHVATVRAHPPSSTRTSLSSCGMWLPCVLTLPPPPARVPPLVTHRCLSPLSLPSPPP